jgi:nucleotide sugar dehydrogenase
MEKNLMSTPILNIKPEDIDNFEKRGKYRVCIVGGGQVGVLHAVLFAEAGFKVICFDADQTVVNHVAKGKARFSGNEIEGRMKKHVRTGRLTATNDIKEAISQSDIVAVTVSVRIDSKKKADYSNIDSICKRIGSSLQLGSLVIIMKPVGIGVVESTVKETLENSSGFKVGADLGLAYSPFYTLPRQTTETTLDRCRVIAATDTKSLRVASAVLGSITKGGLKKTESIKAAEMAALFDVQQQDVNVALTNEFATFCEKVGVDYFEVNEILKSGANSLLSSPNLSNANVQEEPYLLLADAENLNVKLRISATAREINEEAAKHVADLVKDALRSCGKTLRRARVSLLGVSQTPDIKGHPKRIVKQVAQVLTTRGARINLYDPYFSENDLADMRPQFKKNLTAAVEGADCIVILTGHEQFKRLNFNKLKIIMKKPGAIVDCEGIIEPSKVEKEGFIYRGLGRGVWTK